MVLIFYYLQDKKALMTLAYGALSVIVPLVFIFTDILNGFFWFRTSYLFGMLLFIPLLLLYNGQSGKKNFFSKWFFYIYYPLHIFIIYLVEAFIY